MQLDWPLRGAGMVYWVQLTRSLHSVENGIRFPSEVRARRQWFIGAEAERWDYEVRQSYERYRFYGVETRESLGRH